MVGGISGGADSRDPLREKSGGGLNMKMTFLQAASAVAVSMMAWGVPASANTLYFQMNPNFDTGGQRQVFIFGAPNVTGNVIGANGFAEAFDLGAQGFAVVTLAVSAELSSGTVQNLGFKVVSDSAVSGYFLSRRTASTDMTYLIDGGSLGTDHFVLGYQNISADQISVQATVDNTVVTFRPANGTPFDVTLNAGQTYMFTANSNLTGSRVLSTQPVAVFSGNRCTNIPTGVSACDHIVEQMPSLEVLSSSYLLAQTPRTGSLGNVFRAVATADATEIRVNGTVVATLDAGQYYEGRVVGGIEVSANNKILVGQYLIGQGQAAANSDPAMTIVPGQDQWLNSYVFAAPSGSANFPTDFVSIIIGTADLGTLLLDGAAVDGGLFSQLGTSAFSFGNIDVSSTTGPFSISAANPFQLLLSGFDSFDSYFTYGGAAFSPGASPPPDTPPPPPANVVDVFWDGSAPGNAGNGAVDGGDGTLTATSPNLTVDNGGANNSLPVEPANIIFSATPGVVTIDDVHGPVRISGLEFTVGGYRITGDALALQGTTATVSVGNGTPAGAAFSATIESRLDGTAALAKTDLGTLVLAAANSYSGGTTVAGGTLVGNAGTFGSGAVTSNATLVFDQQVDASFGNGIGGTGALVKRGPAALVVEGVNSFSGATSVESGRLLVNGDLAGSIVTVASGATLGGDGTVGGVVALAGSIIAPGQSIGTLHVTGDYSQAAGSVDEVELNSAGQSDRIVATGAASIAAGAIINVVKLDAPRLVLGTRYTVLTAAGGVTGRYVLTGATRVSRFIDLVAAYDPLNVHLDVAQTSSFASAGATPNQIAAASGSDNPGNGALYNAIVYLPDDASARAAFDQISGEIHASARGVAFEDSRFVREAVVGRMSTGQTAGKGLWIHGFGSWGNFDGDGNAAEVERSIGGFFIGGEMVNDDGLTVGVLAGYSAADLNVDARNASADTSDFHLAGYAGIGAGGFQGRVGIANMWRDVKTRRSIAFPGFTDSPRSSYDLSVFQIFGDASYRIDVGGFGLEPFFALAYVDVGGSSFAETGGPGALTAARNGSSGFLVTTLGSRAFFGLPMANGGLGVSATLGWRNTSGDTRTTPVGMAFGSGGAFEIAGAPIMRDAAVLGLSVSGKVARNAEVDFGYSGQAGGGLSDHGVRAAFTFRF